jgi:hypothetical protein
MADLERRSSALHIRIRGIGPPGPVCGPMMSPASGHFVLDVPAGQTTVEIQYRDSIDAVTVQVSEESLQMISVDTGFTTADTRLKWLSPREVCVLVLCV